MVVNVNPIAATPAPLEYDPANAPATSTSLPANITDTVQLTAAGRAIATLSPEEIMLEETDTYAQLQQAAANDDPVAQSLLNALASLPPPHVL